MPSHAPTIARWFQLPLTPPAPMDGLPAVSLPKPGQILLLTGASGSGKSTLLKQIRAKSIAAGRRTIDLAEVRLPDRPTIDVPGAALDQTLRVLSAVGLAEAHTYLLPPSALSEGQRWRLRLAVVLARASRRNSALVVADEFGALLDRVTALTLARALRRLTGQPAYAHLSFALATSHDDLIPALKPDALVRCDFGAYAVESR